MNRRKFLVGGLAIAALAACAPLPIVRQFGRLPDGDLPSPNWRNGEFHNLPNPYVYADLEKEKEYSGSVFKVLFKKDDERYPPGPVPSRRVDLQSLRDGDFVWLGHSSVLLKLAGKTICVDPVLSSHASPVPFIIRAWPGSTPYAARDFPVIDYLLITHDHWDHLDLETVKSLKYRNLICGLGVGGHLAYWGLKPDAAELDWFGEYQGESLKFTFTPSMHFSGRGTTRNRTLWGGFIVDAGSGGRAYFTGDGGFGPHFRDVGARHGPFDIVFPDTGQYNRQWHRMHMFPEQSAQAALDAGARMVCPVHFGKFTLSMHPWNEPATRFKKRAAEIGLRHVLPFIGEKRSLA